MTCTGLSRTVTALNDEWSTLADEPAPLSWRAVPALPLGTLGDVLAGVRSAPDTVLLALLGLQAEGDALAGRVVVQAMLPKMILMAVRDDGVGCMPPAAELVAGLEGHGLANMAARAEEHGGCFTVERGDEGGTSVQWRVPLPALYHAKPGG